MLVAFAQLRRQELLKQQAHQHPRDQKLELLTARVISTLCRIYKHSQSIVNLSVWVPNQRAIGVTAVSNRMEVPILVHDSTRSVIQEKLKMHVTTRTGNNGNPTRTAIRKRHCRDSLPSIPAKLRLYLNIRSSLSQFPPIPAKMPMDLSDRMLLQLGL